MRAPVFALRVAACCLAVACAALGAPRTAHACTPPPGGLPIYTPAERALSAEIVLVGTVDALSDGPGSIPGDTATIVVERYLKGAGPDPITVSGYGPSSICRSPVQAGQRYLFYIVGDGPDSYRAYYKSQFDAVDPPTAENIARIEAALANTLYLAWLASPAQAPEPGLTTGGRAAPAERAEAPALGGLTAAAGALLSLFGLVAVARRRP